MADQTEYGLDEIEIVAHESVSPDLLPGILTAIFRLRQAPHDLILPSYRIEGERLIGGALDSEDALEEMVWLKEAVRLPQPIEPRAGYVLWIDERYQVSYEPQTEVLDRLRRRAEQCVAEAIDALEKRRFNAALALAQTAISADEDCYDAVVVKGVVYTVQKNAPFVDELRHLAMAIDPEKDFDYAVKLMSWVVPSSACGDSSDSEFFRTDLEQVRAYLQSAGFSVSV